MTGILIGYKSQVQSEPVGFSGSSSAGPVSASQDAAQPVYYDDEGHLITIAPTGAGKGVGCIVPAILRHKGPVLALDLKGENFVMTRRHRTAIGSPVACIDPFGIASRLLGDAAARQAAAAEFRGFNPLNLLPYLSDDRDAACRTLADKLMPPLAGKEDPFWRSSAVTLLAGLIDHYERLEGPLRSVAAIVHDLNVEDPRIRQAGKLDRMTDACSRIASSPDILDAMELARVTPADAWHLFDSMSEVHGSEILNQNREAELIRTAIQRTLEQNPGRDTELDQGIISDISASIVTQSSLRTEFERVATAALGIPTKTVAELWQIFRGVVSSSHVYPAEGSFCDRMGDEDVPIGFPIAMHRLAHSASSVGIAASSLVECADKTWSSILVTLRSGIAEFSGRSIARTLSGHNGIDLEALRRGDDMSLYVAFPPDRARSHATLFRVVIDGLMTVLSSRTHRPRSRTLVLLDEVAQLGRMESLVLAKTLLRGYGVQVWSFWQDISQLQANYPADWPTVLNNCRVVQVFGRGTGTMSNELGRALDIAPDRITDLAQKDLIAWVDGPKPMVLRRPVAYADPDLAPLCDDGPFALPSDAEILPLANSKPDLLSEEEVALQLTDDDRDFIDLMDEGDDDHEPQHPGPELDQERTLALILTGAKPKTAKKPVKRAANNA